MGRKFAHISTAKLIPFLHRNLYLYTPLYTASQGRCLFGILHDEPFLPLAYLHPPIK